MSQPKVRIRMWVTMDPHNARKSHMQNDALQMYTEKEGPLGIPTYMLFTGCIDALGRDVFEGDIVQDAAGVLKVVKYMPDYMCYALVESENDTTVTANFEIANRCIVGRVVVGNVFENPELLTLEIEHEKSDMLQELEYVLEELDKQRSVSAQKGILRRSSTRSQQHERSIVEENKRAQND